MEYVATKHAYKRAKERLGWNKKALNRMMGIAFEEGISHKQCKQALRKFIDHVWLKHKKGNNIRIHGEILYLFDGRTLITIYRLDNKTIKKIKYTKEAVASEQ